MNFLLETLRLGLANLALHKLRSFLTALGIIIGVVAVIVMTAIGEGQKRRALADIEKLGARNIILRSVKPPEPQNAGDQGRRLLAYGIKRTDARCIEETVRGLQRIVPLKQVGSSVTLGERKIPAAVFGTIPDLREVANLSVARGRYLARADENQSVAVIGAEIADRLFPLSDPLEGSIRVDNQSFRVVGVLGRIGLAGGAGTALVGRDLNFDVHVPMSTAETRFGDMVVSRASGSFDARLMELSEIYLEVAAQEGVRPVADQVNLLVDTAHGKTGDVSVIVPMELLEQAERTQRMFNFLMLAIATLSLIVGGIGIMNIMLASVTERIREIGIRRAVGATRRHITAQFLVETTVLSGLGGLMGVALGILATAGVDLMRRVGWISNEAIGQPYVTPFWVVASFAVASAVGVIFGLYPAMQAANQDPIVALRHD